MPKIHRHTLAESNVAVTGPSRRICAAIGRPLHGRGCAGHSHTLEKIFRREGAEDLAGFGLAECEQDLTPNFELMSAPQPTT